MPVAVLLRLGVQLSLLDHPVESRLGDVQPGCGFLPGYSDHSDVLPVIPVCHRRCHREDGTWSQGGESVMSPTTSEEFGAFLWSSKELTAFVMGGCYDGLVILSN